MIRSMLFSTALFSALATSAIAGSPPVSVNTTPEQVAEACSGLGASGEAVRFGGSTGCRNTATGGAVACEENGPCKDYFADPRTAKIKAALSGNTQQAPARL